MRRVRVGDLLLRVRDEPESGATGTVRGGGGLSLVCVHGAGMSSVVFMDTVRRFAPGRRVVAPDLPGHGQSARYSSLTDIGVQGYAATVAGLCDALRLTRVVLVGHSLGAAVALMLATQQPDRVAGLVLLNGAAQLDVSDDVFGLLQAVCPSLDLPQGERERVDRMPDAVADLMFSPHVSSDLRARWQAMLWATDRDVLLADFAACRGLDLRARLPVVRQPVLSIAGVDDLMVAPSRSADTAARLSDAEHHALRDCGHLAHIERADAVYGLIDAFVRRCEKSQADSGLGAQQAG